MSHKLIPVTLDEEWWENNERLRKEKALERENQKLKDANMELSIAMRELREALAKAKETMKEKV